VTTLGEKPDPNLPELVQTVTQAQLDRYARASGDRNPLHWDPEFAAGTRFGGIIAHGMLTLALVAEMMSARFGKPWQESGSLKVRFKGAAYVGDEVETWGRLTREEQQESQRRVTFSVGVRNRRTGSEIISGTATVNLPAA
jgi:acyl dehydratase